MAVVRDHAGRDFTDYRPTTLLRRIARRMRLAGHATPDDYLRRLAADRDEAQALADDLLITVTSFFRDPWIWQELEHVVLPPLLDRAAGLGRVRVWSAGCASGQEAYSIAMALLDLARGRGDTLRIEILATELHPGALRRAAAGQYRADVAEAVPPERLARYFHAEEAGFRVGEELRRLVTFRRHDLLREPPPGTFDLVLCRNVLIFLDRGAQRALIGALHGALDEEGVLMLGRAETVWDEDLFRSDHRRQRLFRKRPSTTPAGSAR